MLETVAILVLALLAAALVLAKARARLKAPGARRSRGDASPAAHGRRDDRDGGDG